ncbi:MAG TPA: flagellar export chaperone FliS [Rubrivivax sp.]|nr:flagellar export chaperone FliS [Burkholderiales bacterium]HNT37533.1 flagellar export chaperone FliS [Rubrivivax sp.]
MFSNAAPRPFGRTQVPLAYRKMAAETAVADASPHRLVAMLFEGFIDALAEARGAMRQRDIERKGRALNRATRIVEEGLRAGLDLRAGGRLAADLDRLYGYIGTRLMQANLRNDESLIDECQRLVQPLRQAWDDIAPAVRRPDA